MEKARDLRYVEQKGKWYPSTSANRSVASKSRSATRQQYASVSPIRSENGMQKPALAPAAATNKGEVLLQSVRTTPDLRTLSTPLSQMTTPRKKTANGMLHKPIAGKVLRPVLGNRRSKSPIDATRPQQYNTSTRSPYRKMNDYPWSSGAVQNLNNNLIG